MASYDFDKLFGEVNPVEGRQAFFFKAAFFDLFEVDITSYFFTSLMTYFDNYYSNLRGSGINHAWAQRRRFLGIFF